jgi:hypothetical protein
LAWGITSLFRSFCHGLLFVDASVRLCVKGFYSAFIIFQV